MGQSGLSVKIGKSLITLFIGYMVSVLFSYYNSAKIQDKLPSISDFAISSTEISQKIVVGFNRQNKLYENAVMTGEADMIEEAKKEAVQILMALERLAKLEAMGQKTKSDIASIVEKLRRYTDEASEVYSLFGKGEETPLEQASRLAQEKTRITSQLANISVLVRKDLSENIDDVIRESQQRNKFNILLSLLIIMMSVIAIRWVIRKSVTQKLHRISEGLMVSSAKVAHASSKMSVESEQLATGALQQEESMKATSHLLEKILSVIKENIASTIQVRGVREEIYSYIQIASTAMKETAEAMRRIKHQGEQIAKITNAIDDIAFQTNLLALNAAVEAARAGEFGAGFGVVAGEVRNLALKTGESAENIRNLIENTVSEIDLGAALVEKTGHSFQTSMEYSMKAGELIEEIFEASQEQSDGIEQISAAMAEVQQITRLNAANAENSASVSVELYAQADLMSSFVNELAALLEGEKSSPTTGQALQEKPDLPVEKRE
jgi:methyl-accepting chemotaxis protein